MRILLLVLGIILIVFPFLGLFLLPIFPLLAMTGGIVGLLGAMIISTVLGCLCIWYVL